MSHFISLSQKAELIAELERMRTEIETGIISECLIVTRTNEGQTQLIGTGSNNSHLLAGMLLDAACYRLGYAWREPEEG